MRGWGEHAEDLRAAARIAGRSFHHAKKDLSASGPGASGCQVKLCSVALSSSPQTSKASARLYLTVLSEYEFSKDPLWSAPCGTLGLRRYARISPTPVRF
jgi:hypothetical protein